MRTLRTLLAALLATALLIAPPALAAPSALDGGWIVGEVDGDDFDFLLDLHDGTGTMRARRADDGFRPVRLTVTSSEGALLTLRLDAEKPGVPSGRAWMLVRTPDEALFWTPKNDSLMLVRRRVAMPAALLGEWRAGLPGEPAQRVTVKADTVVFSAEGKDDTYPAWPLASSGGTLDVVLAPNGGEGRIHHFQPLPDGSMMVWRAESSEYRVFYRGDKPPAWVAPPTKR